MSYYDETTYDPEEEEGYDPDSALLKNLVSENCRCGAEKKSEQSFCGECYFKLSLTDRKALYRKLNSGYQEAYRKALKVLISEGRIEA